MTHPGAEKGFIPNALSMWKAGQSSGNCHEQVNKLIMRNGLQKICCYT